MEGFSSNQFSWKKHPLFVVFRWPPPRGPYRAHRHQTERLNQRFILRRSQGRNASFSENLFCKNFPFVTNVSASPAYALFATSFNDV